ncbi:MAG: tetratricopeptide repeat protein [Gemmataceae bacterium]|nr:tetratricopeptide repeat protein [Gemmataceae bacterium]
MTPTDDLFAQAVSRHQAGDVAAAEDLYRRVLAADPRHPGAMSNLGVILSKAGQLDEAARLYAAALAVNPRQLDAHFNLGNLYRRLGRLQAAADAYHAVLAVEPNHARAYLNLGLVQGDAGDWVAAIDCFRRAVALDPGLAEAHNLLGDALNRTGLRDESVRVFREYVTRFPDDPRGHHNLAFAFASVGSYEDAVAELELALKQRPDYAEAHNTLGVTLEAVGRADEGMEHFREAVRLRPEFAEAWNNLGTNLTEQGRTGEAIPALQKAQERPTYGAASNYLLALCYSSDPSPEQLREVHLAWAARFADPLRPAEPPRVANPDPDRRLRIGYVSSDFRAHPAAGFIEHLLTHHDRNAVHVSCYASVNVPDSTTDRLRRLADAWHPTATLSDAALADKVRADEIDVLIDLNGHTAGNRLLAFARQPAPVQLTLFGYPCTTGIRAFDCFVTDPHATPPEFDPLFAEGLLHLPEVGWVYQPPAAAPALNALPAQARRTFTFGCLNNPAKLSDACLVAWAAILKAVPRSRLVLLAGRSAEAARALTARFTELEISSDRLELVYRLPTQEYFEAYQPIDLCLDPFPFNGMLTTCDALWMGLPVLTVAGADTRGRQGVSLLNNLGLPEFVAETPEKLVELAVIWSDQRAGLADLRGSLREMMRQSAVTAAERYVRHLEEGLRAVWQQKCG